MPTPKSVAKATRTVIDEYLNLATPESRIMAKKAEEMYGAEATRKVMDFLNDRLGITPDMPNFSMKMSDALDVLTSGNRIGPGAPKPTPPATKSVLDNAKDLLQSGKPGPDPATALVPVPPIQRVGRQIDPASGDPIHLYGRNPPTRELQVSTPTARLLAQTQTPAAAAPTGPGKLKAAAGGLAAGAALTAAGVGGGDGTQPPAEGAAPAAQPPAGAKDQAAAPEAKGKVEEIKDPAVAPPKDIVREISFPIVPRPEPLSGDQAHASYQDRSEVYAQMNDARQQLVRDTNAAMEDFKEAKSEIRKQEIWERVIKGVSHLFAGWYGAKNNVAITNLDIPLSDFTAKEQAALQEHSAALRAAEARQAARRQEYADRLAVMDQMDRNEDRRVTENRALWEQAMQVAKDREQTLMNKAMLQYRGMEMELQQETRRSQHAASMAELDMRERIARSKGDTDRAASLAKQREDAEKIKLKLAESIAGAKAGRDERESLGKLIEARNLNNDYFKATGQYLVNPNLTNSTNPEDWSKSYFMSTEGAPAEQSPANAPGSAATQQSEPPKFRAPPPDVEVKWFKDSRGIVGWVPVTGIETFLKRDPAAVEVQAP